MKVYILTDLEGVAGVTKFEHCQPGQRFYSRSCELLTLEVNAAVSGALMAGADEIIVWDGHGPGAIEPRLLHTEARLISGKGNIQYCGLDTDFDAMMIVGQHAMNRVEKANLSHSYSSRSISRMILNGEEIGEIGMRVYMAGFLGVPVVMISGDDKACFEAQKLVPEIEMVAVKEGLSREDALAVSPEKARQKIKKGALCALERLHSFKPVTIPGPYQLETEFFAKDPDNPDARDWDRPVQETDVETADDFLDLTR